MKYGVCSIVLVILLGNLAPCFALSSSFNKTTFPLKLYKQLAKEKEDKNILVSPFSISSALGMTINGAKNKTRADLVRVLGFDNVNVQKINQNAKSTRSSLQSLNQGTKLEIANALYGKSGTSFSKKFLLVNKQYYNAGIQVLNFDSPQAANTINKWVSVRTHNKIPRVIERVTNNDVLLLVNAIYFKGKWQYEFNKSRTSARKFYLNEKATKNVQMMHMTNDNFKYYATAGFQALKLNYKDKRLSLVLILPRQNESLALFESELSHETWIDILSSFRKQRGHLSLPKFRIEDQMNLKKPLAALGLKDAFICGAADFTGMTTNRSELYISRVIHKSFMEVNEEGTEAAAATAVVNTAKGLFHPPRVPTFRMVLNRPFLFAVHDSKTDTILFMGHVANPQSI